MLHHILSRVLPCFSALFLVSMLPASGRAPDMNDKKSQARLRLIIVSSLAGDQQVVLASRDAEGKWRELATTEIRRGSITDWLPAQAGELHLALREGGSLKSICRFTYPADSRLALVALIADPKKHAYEAQVVDPESTGFVEGSMLIFNFSTQVGLVSPGSGEVRVEAGRQVVAKPALDDKGMYGLRVSCPDAQNKPVLCFDSYSSGDPGLRKMLFLLPEPNRGIRVLSLPILGSFD